MMHVFRWLVGAALAGWCHMANAGASETSAALKKLKELAATPLADRGDTWLCEFLAADTCSKDGCERESLAPQLRWVILDFAAASSAPRQVA